MKKALKMYNQVFYRTKAVFSRCLEPFKRQESHEVKQCGNSGCHLQKYNSFTGFAATAKSKRCRGMAIKVLVLLLCTTGFVYQTWSFMQMYLAYPTTLDITDEYPDSFTAPAVTICNKNRLMRQQYCKKFPEKCSWEHTTWETFCDKHSLLCPGTQPPDFSFGMPVYQTKAHLNKSNAFLNAVGPQEETNMITRCLRIYGGDYKNCNLNITWIQVPRNGLPYKCFSLFSLLGEPNKEYRNLTMSDGFDVDVDMHPEEQFNTHDLVEVWVALHDPRKLVNPMKEGITLTSGSAYHLFPSMEETERLPPPYASKCMDYLSEWKKNGGSGPLSKDDCISECKIKAMLDKYRCVGETVTYPNNNTICVYVNDDDTIFCNRIHYEVSASYVTDASNIVTNTPIEEVSDYGRLTRNSMNNYPKKDQDASPEMNRMCTSTCRDACKEHIYHLTSDTYLDFKGECKATDEHCKNRYLGIFVHFNRLKVKKIKQIPRIESIELFSYIGGYLGMWLGISLASLFDLAEMIYDFIAYAFLKRKRNKETITPIEQFRHHSAIKI